jgi:pimeloyl-ACP methyl ester carboxylesterase
MRTTANGITIEYETFGDPTAEPMLLVMGFAGQLVHWPRELLSDLAARGFWVIIFDNRDAGRSSTSDAESERVPVSTSATATSSPPYRLEDMAADGIGLLDALGIDAAHLVGMSMGGFIVQLMAISHPDRVRTLCSIMSTPGDPAVPPPAPEAMAALLQPPAETRAEFIDQSVRIAHVIGSTALGIDEERVRARAAATFDRGLHPAGRIRQALAIAAAADRTKRLGLLTVPTVVIHGADDKLVSPVGGELTAKAVPGAELVMIPGMAHDLPEAAWPIIVDAIAANAAKARGDGQ